MANNRTDWRRVAAAAMLTIAMGTTDDPHPMSADRVLYALREVAIVCKTAIGHHDREETLTKMAEEIEHIDDFLRLN